ncbi:uncharacterized protein LOC142022943 [Carettochelys insculpta]|uniref:uncharacterized protein LOC142022943 n=1 Tax=Carettochelys insculpta TaxID=44489 RepID=UPI003EB69BBF
MAEARCQEAPAAVSGERARRIGVASHLETRVLAQCQDAGDMDEFLTAFERACELHEVPPDEWLRHLTPLLGQKAAAVLSQLVGLQPGDYERFKQALLHKFGLTTEMYKKKFQEAQKRPEETHVDTTARLKQYYQKWAFGMEVQSVEDLIELAVVERFYEMCAPDLRVWLVDRKPGDSHDAGKLADDFTNSRARFESEPHKERESWRDRESQRDRSLTVRQRGPPLGQAQERGASHPPPREPNRARTEQPARGTQQDPGCYRCGRKGHRAA